MDDGKFDVLVIGTGLTESITAAALAKAGFKVAHVDENPYYGGNEATLTLDELVQWADTQASGTNPKYSSVSRFGHPPQQSRQYSISLRPAVIPSIGPIISSLVSSGVSKYGGFRLLERVGLYHPSGIVKSVPGSKEDIFKSKDISLVDKRRLMRFLQFAVGDFENKEELRDANEIPLPEFLKAVFSLPEDIVSFVLYSLSFSFSLSDNTLLALQRIRRYLRSAGRFGPSPFLIGHYGGAGEIAQGFCRASAVSGGVYILGRRILSITHNPNPNPVPLLSSLDQGDSGPTPRYQISLEDFPETLTANVIISSSINGPSHLVPYMNQIPPPTHHTVLEASVARCIVITDQPIHFSTVLTSSHTSSPDGGPALAGSSSVSESGALDQAQEPLDAAILVFPPSTVEGGSTTTAATVLVMGESTMSTPTGKWLLYIALPLLPPLEESSSAQQLLQPYLDATLALSLSSSDPSQIPLPPTSTAPPLFTLFYIEHPERAPDVPVNAAATPKTYIVPPPLPPGSPLPDTLDNAATYAEVVFWEVVEHFRNQSRSADDGKQVVGLDIKSFWSSGDQMDNSDGEEDW